jgi:threonine synthase
VVNYQSTRGSTKNLSFEDTVISGLAPDKGLYLPDSTTLNNLSLLTQEDLSYEDFVKTVFIALDKNSASLIDDISLYPGFEVDPTPALRELSNSVVVMELFNGPTKSFKDYALQPLGAIANKRLSEIGERGLVIVATSGDTGSAAIQAVKESENIDIVVLHPANKISEYQRKQMTSIIQDNVFNIAVEGSYDDCQRIAKELLQENPFNRRIISLNSINWLRVMGQLSYYVWLTTKFSSPINVAIPSGNFGNAYSAWFGRQHGLSIKNILCSTNVNDVLRRFIESGTLKPKETYPSIAPSMDIQIPSSLERLIFDLSGSAEHFYNTFSTTGEATLKEDALNTLKMIFSSETFNDEDIKHKIGELYKEFDYIFDPHTATSVAMALNNEDNIPTVAVATASPEKFGTVINAVIDGYSIVSLDEKEELIQLAVNKDVITTEIKNFFK